MSTPIRVWVSREEPEDGPLCTALRRNGLEPVLIPVIQRRVTGDASPFISRLGPQDWLVLTSTFAVEAVAVNQPRCRVAVVGEASRRAAEAVKMNVALVSPDGTGEGLWGVLRQHLDGVRRICYPRSSLADAAPSWPGVEIDSPVLYVTEPRRVDASMLRGVCIVAVASPSAARAVHETAPNIRCASIGPTTSAELRAIGVEPWLESPEPGFDALAAAIAEKLKTARS